MEVMLEIKSKLENVQVGGADLKVQVMLRKKPNASDRAREFWLLNFRCI